MNANSLLRADWSRLLQGCCRPSRDVGGGDKEFSLGWGVDFAMGGLVIAASG